MSNPFRQLIGIWYTSKDDRDKVFNALSKSFSRGDMVTKIVTAFDYESIEFANGDIIRFLHMDWMGRGYRFTDSFIVNPKNTEEFVCNVNTLVKVETTLGGCGVWVIDNLNSDCNITRRFMTRRSWDSWLKANLGEQK